MKVRALDEFCFSVLGAVGVFVPLEIVMLRIKFMLREQTKASAFASELQDKN
jgi:hypothetical protein